MSTNERKDQGATDEALSRDSLQRLAKLRVDVALLARLVRTRRAEAAQDDAAGLRLDEALDSLTWLEAQIEQVLADDPAASADTETLDEAELGLPGEEDEPVAAAPKALEPYISGITLGQIDEINLLLESIRAHGDVVNAAGHAEFAAATLSVIGYNIFREVEQVRDMLSTVLDEQKLEPSCRQRPSVREEQATYLALPGPVSTGSTRHGTQPSPVYH